MDSPNLRCTPESGPHLLCDKRRTLCDAELIAEIGNRSFFEQVAFEDGDFLGAGKVTTRLVHGKPPFRYGTLPDHAESGEERFAVDWNREDDSV